MEPRGIYITDYDLTRLKELLDAGISVAAGDRHLLETLQGELDRAHIVEPSAVPPDVVTMNSRVRLIDVETKEEQVYTIVFPSEAKLEERKISILAPIGTALLGYRVGDTVEWPVPGGIRRLRIEELQYQPEAAGEYRR
ncbi:MAG: Regulator of nucleoside diphosphate kinase [Nitrospira sp.]|jgi:regulator of nucleoside diphosphate kinase|nr:MAG: Regulator of nucleoside diphosphate kinase [Nitrospira sp.]